MKLQLLEYIDQNLPEGFTPYSIYQIFVCNQEVGRLTFREGTLEEHYYDGHIGYHIEEEYRGHQGSERKYFPGSEADASGRRTDRALLRK